MFYHLNAFSSRVSFLQLLHFYVHHRFYQDYCYTVVVTDTINSILLTLGRRIVTGLVAAERIRGAKKTESGGGECTGCITSSSSFCEERIEQMPHCRI